MFEVEYVRKIQSYKHDSRYLLMKIRVTYVINRSAFRI